MILVRSLLPYAARSRWHPESVIGPKSPPLEHKYQLFQRFGGQQANLCLHLETTCHLIAIS